MNNILQNSSKLKTEFSISFCRNNKLKYSFEFDDIKKTFVENDYQVIDFLNDFLSNIYYYLLSYYKNEIEHKNYYSATIEVEKEKIIDVEFKLIKPSIISFRVWERKSYSTPNTKSKEIFITKMDIKDFLIFILKGYSNFLKKYGLTQIKNRCEYSQFPIIDFLKLLNFLKHNNKNKICDFKILEQNISFSEELELLKV